MAKKKPSLEQLTQKQEREAAYAACVLGGVQFCRVTRSVKMMQGFGRAFKNGWYYKVPNEASWIGPYSLRRTAVFWAHCRMVKEAA